SSRYPVERGFLGTKWNFSDCELRGVKFPDPSHLFRYKRILLIQNQILRCPFAPQFVMRCQRHEVRVPKGRHQALYFHIILGSPFFDSQFWLIRVSQVFVTARLSSSGRRGMIEKPTLQVGRTCLRPKPAHFGGDEHANSNRKLFHGSHRRPSSPDRVNLTGCGGTPSSAHPSPFQVDRAAYERGPCPRG